MAETVAETSKVLENDPSWFINTHWRVARPTIPDQQNQALLIEHNRDNLVNESENTDIRKPEILTQTKILSELPDELTDVVATISSKIVLQSENLTDPTQIEIVTAVNNCTSGDQHDIADQFDRLNNFPTIDSSNASERRIFNNVHTLHDSGFISGRGITNT